jgi:NADPH-dependent 2,4-dienoyl-CoA reductase/sulfur reductase-like enzyme
MIAGTIAIVGAGPAGIGAALRARALGADVTVFDDNFAPGGQIWRGGYSFRDAGIRFVSQARIVSARAADRTLNIERPDEAFEFRYDRLILATGARELFLPFPGWTLPGVAGVGGLQALVKGGVPIRGKRVAVAGSGPLLLAGAAFLRKAGADVVLIAEQAAPASVARFGTELVRHPGKLLQGAALQWGLLGVPYRLGCRLERAEGSGRVERVWFRSGGGVFAEEVDYAAVAWGLVPNTELARMLGCHAAATVEVDELQRTSLESVWCAGEATGIGGVDVSYIEGEIAGCAAAGDEGGARGLLGKRARARRFADAANRAFRLNPELRGLPDRETIVCRCEDVTFGRLGGTRSFREAKLLTRCGMGPCQGRVCGAAGEFLFGWQDGSVRPPMLPARVETLICSASPQGYPSLDSSHVSQKSAHNR